MRFAALLAIALLGGPDGEPCAEASAAATGPRDAPSATAQPSSRGSSGAEPFASRAGSRHALALGWHGTSFFSTRGSHYVFHSASVGYLGSFGKRGPFVHATALLPLQARQDGRVYATGDYYGPRSGADLLVGWQWRLRVRGAEVEMGPGLHGAFLWLPGKRGYRDFSALPLGLGATSAVRWRGGATVLSRALTVGAYGSLNYDFYDPLRADDLSHGVTSRAGVLVGLEARP
jgi:hypothetical protein